MKKALHISFSLLFACYVLASTIGVGVYKQTCLLFGKTSYSLSAEDKCCPKDKDGDIQTTLNDGFKCCEHNSFYAKADFESFSKFELPPFQLYAYTLSYPVAAATTIGQSPTRYHYTDSSPPWLHGQGLFLQVGHMLL